MLVRIGLELNNEGRALAWALDFPGCFAYGEEGPDAVMALPPQLVAYEGWVTEHGGALRLGDFDLRIVDTWQVYTVDDAYNLTESGYAVNAWFKQDWKPLSAAEVEEGMNLLRWSREDFLKVVESLTDGQLDQTYPDERWPIRGIARHVANAEWWYLDQLGLAEEARETLPKDLFERLVVVREQLVNALPKLAGRELVLGKQGEFWSPRKLLRRALWHEIDHRQHILKLLARSIH